MNSSLERSRRIRTIGIYAFFIIGCVIMIFPFAWMFLTSFKTVEESMRIPPAWSRRRYRSKSPTSSPS